MYRRRTGGGITLIIAAAMALFGLFRYFGSSQINAVTGEKQYVSISPTQEIALGLQAAPQMAEQFGGISDDPEGRRAVEAVGQRIVDSSDARKSPYKFEFHLLGDPKTVNAFALPGGQIFITEALFRKLRSEAELAGVLGHEVGHVIARHGAEHLAKQQLTQTLTGAAVLASYDPNNPASRNSAAVAMAVGQLVNMKFGREDELESDKWGVRLLGQSGYDPRAMIGVMEVLRESANRGKTPEFFSTHPNPENRIERIREAIKKEYPGGIPAGLKR